MYETLYQMCRNVENVMGYFSEELRILDKNTVKLMIEEQQKEIEEQQKEIEGKQKEIEKQQREIDSLKEINKEKGVRLEELLAQIKALKRIKIVESLYKN